MTVLKQLNKNIWQKTVELDGFEVCSILICDDDHAVIWDTLSHPHDMEEYGPIIQDKKLTIIYSHADWDHIWGTAGLRWQDAQIIGHAHCLDRFSRDVPETLQQMQKDESEKWMGVELIPPNQTFQDRLTLSFGSISIELYALPGHTNDSIIAFLPGNGLLLMGDTVETPIPSIPSAEVLPDWIQALEKWENDSRVNIVIPSHGDIGGKKIIHSNIQYLKALQLGNQFDLPDDVSQFYRQTHEENLQKLKKE